jgi:hypothetical protein
MAKKIIHPDQIVVCDCHSNEHHIQLHYWKNNDNCFSREVYISPFLNTHRNFFKRVRVAIGYIFGYKCAYGQWDGMVVTKENYHAFKDMIDFLDEKIDIVDTFAIRDEEIRKYNERNKTEK